MKYGFSPFGTGYPSQCTHTIHFLQYIPREPMDYVSDSCSYSHVVANHQTRIIGAVGLE